MKVLITVGSTEFDQMIRILDTEEMLSVLRKHGYEQVRMQIGRGEYIPTKVENFRLKVSLAEDMAWADLVITHCGAGTLLECLRSEKKIIAVNNETLMNNHQMELLNKLRKDKYLVGVTSSSELSNLDQYLQELKQLVKYQAPKSNAIDAIIEDMFQ